MHALAGEILDGDDIRSERRQPFQKRLQNSGVKIIRRPGQMGRADNQHPGRFSVQALPVLARIESTRRLGQGGCGGQSQQHRNQGESGDDAHGGSSFDIWKESLRDSPADAHDRNLMTASTRLAVDLRK